MIQGVSREKRVVDRDLILSWLREDVQQLRKWATAHHTVKSPIRVSLLRASIYGCSIMLQTLKEKELEELAEEVEAIKHHVGLKK